MNKTKNCCVDGRERLKLSEDRDAKRMQNENNNTTRLMKYALTCLKEIAFLVIVTTDFADYYRLAQIFLSHEKAQNAQKN